MFADLWVKPPSANAEHEFELLVSRAAIQPPVRQAERPAPNPGRAVGKRVGTDSVELDWPQSHRVTETKQKAEGSRQHTSTAFCFLPFALLCVSVPLWPIA